MADSVGSTPESSTDSTTPSSSRTLRERSRESYVDTYMDGRSRKAYKLRKDIDTAQKCMGSPPHMPEQVCHNCSVALSRVQQSFFGLKRQGSEIKRRQVPTNEDKQHYRNLVAQNEWLRANVFDAMGNYLFCQQCITVALQISKQRLVQQRCVKRNQYQKPVVEMSKENARAEKLQSFVLMPDELDTAFVKWWDSIPAAHIVRVRHPYERHGLAGKTSNNAKVQLHDDFLRFVDRNSKPNGRKSDSHGATHYFLPKFTTMRMPSHGVLHYDEKMATSLVGEFNRTKLENSKMESSNGSACDWLKQDRPKHALYPHKSDYCDFCTEKNEAIKRQQTMLNRIRQSGNSSDEEQQVIELDIAEVLHKHKMEATRSLENYHQMSQRCEIQWKEIANIEKNSQRTTEEDDKLQGLKESFILVLSSDYQMGKLLLSWCLSPQPSSTYYFQKLSCDILGIIDHRNGSAATYIFDERIGPKNTDHTVSYIMHYLKSDKVPSWIRRVQLFMDNAGSTNKNQHVMGAAMEIVQQNLLSFFRISFKVVGHTKFDPGRLFSNIARAFNRADTFNISQLAELISQYADVTVDDGKLVRAWRSLLPDKYSLIWYTWLA